MNETIKRTDPLSTTSYSIDALEEIVRNYKRNEQSIHELVRNTRYERRKAERFLQQIYQSLEENDKQLSTSSFNSTIIKPIVQKPVEFFISFDTKTKINNHSHNRNNSSKIKTSFRKSILKERDNKSMSSILSDNTIRSDHSMVSNNHRVRFNIPEKTNRFLNSSQSNTIYDELSDLARRCENLLSGFEINRKQTTYDDCKNPLIYPQYNLSIGNKKAYEYRSSNTNPYLKRINPLCEEHDHKHEINRKCQQIRPFTCSNRISYDTYQSNPVRLPLSNEKNEIKQTFDINDRREKDLMNSTHLRNNLRQEILQLRLRQNSLIHGRTYINDSLVMTDT